MARRELTAYTAKRDLSATPEPAPEAQLVRREGPLRFMVHKHAARRLHYDLRLECDGVLLSWAVPKGPSTDPAERRLAVQVEDHPLDYALFEGNIPQGSYGAGPSMVWDAGTYSPDEDGQLRFIDREGGEREMRAGLDAGKISVTLRGAKLKGSWALVHTHGNDWLLIKHRDGAANSERDILGEDRSVASGRTIEELRRDQPPRRAMPEDSAFSPSQIAGARRAPFQAVAPMLASAGAMPAGQTDWTFEPKLDGIRLVAMVSDGSVRLRTRGGTDATAQYPALVGALAKQPANQVTFDGEVVAIDEHGRPSFELLQQRVNLVNQHDIARAEQEIPVVYFVFDVLHLDGYDLAKTPLESRREVLRRVLMASHTVALVETIEADADAAYEAAIAAGFEGVVAKKATSLYQPGRRATTWIKRKATDSQEFVVGGFTAGQGSRGASFGGLLLGTREGGELRYRGKVGSGFNDAALEEISARLAAATAATSPFGASDPHERDVRYVVPNLRVEVEHRGFTQAGLLRAPVFKRIVETRSPAKPSANARAEGGPRTEADAASASIRRQLVEARSRTTIEGDGWRLGLTNLEKALWPASDHRGQVTKRELLLYALDVWPYAAPHLRDRLLTLSRYPDGITGKTFYQRHWDDKRPGFVETVTVFSETDGRDRAFLLCNNLPTLLWLCQLADIEWHVSFGRCTADRDGSGQSTDFRGSLAALERSILNYPDFLVFDLDPYIYAGTERRGEEPQPNRGGYSAACEVALALKEMLDSLGLASFPKSSGATGIHVYVPIARHLDYGTVRSACTTLAAELNARMPRLTTMEWDTSKRKGKVFLDANQNARHKSLAAPYSPRAKPGAPVSLPMAWDEIERTYPPDVSFEDVAGRLNQRGDPWAGIFEMKHDIEAMLR